MKAIAWIAFALSTFLAVATASAASIRSSDSWLPADPGAAHCSIGGGDAELANSALRFAVTTRDATLRPAAFDNRFVNAAHELHGELFRLLLTQKRELVASAFRLHGKIACAEIKASPKSVRAAERLRGVALIADLTDEVHGVRVHWRALLRDHTNYVREEITISAAHDVDADSIALIDFDLAGAYAVGTVQGSPLVADDRFFAFEHPMAQMPRIEAGHATVLVRRELPLRANVAASYSAVLGVATPGQLRRAFAAYVESERAHPFRTFLHYNSWYDIGYFTPYTQDDAMRAVHLFADKLVKRGVKMDSFLFDDGWDDHANLWQFNAGFPHGFSEIARAAEKVGADPGVWLSPWGGYGAPRKERLAAAKVAGYEIDDQGLALSGPKYYALFHKAAFDLLTRDHINQFKFDGTGSPDKVTPGSAFDSDFAAAIALIDDLRAVKPDLFINLTTGTWPSPFWLRTSDSIWRGGEDHEFAGQGSDRQRWITYRDADTYGGIVRQGPLFPLNSLMLHGIIYAKHARGLSLNPDPGDFRDEVRSYFASGTGLQEMYVSPDLLGDADWDVLASAARWARSRADVLRDSHWIGGDPARADVYGWGAWTPARAVIALRNPAPRAQILVLDLAAALELPAGSTTRFRAESPYGLDARDLDAAQAIHIELQPFQVLVWDLTPTRSDGAQSATKP